MVFQWQFSSGASQIDTRWKTRRNKNRLLRRTAEQQEFQFGFTSVESNSNDVSQLHTLTNPSFLSKEKVPQKKGDTTGEAVANTREHQKKDL